MDKRKLNVGQVLILRRGDKREEVKIISIGRSYLFISEGRRVEISSGETSSQHGKGAFCGRCYVDDAEFERDMVCHAWRQLRQRISHSDNFNPPKELTLANLCEAEKLLFGGA